MSKINCFNVLTKKQSDFFLDEINGWLKNSKYDFITVPDSLNTNYSFNFIFDGQEVKFNANTWSNSQNLEKEGAFEKYLYLRFNFNFGSIAFGLVRFNVGRFVAAVDNGEMKFRFDDIPIDECYKELMETLLDSIRKENS